MDLSTDLTEQRWTALHLLQPGIIGSVLFCKRSLSALTPGVLQSTLDCQYSTETATHTYGIQACQSCCGAQQMHLLLQKHTVPAITCSASASAACADVSCLRIRASSVAAVSLAAAAAFSAVAARCRADSSCLCAACSLPGLALGDS